MNRTDSPTPARAQPQPLGDAAIEAIIDHAERIETVSSVQLREVGLAYRALAARAAAAEKAQRYWDHPPSCTADHPAPIPTYTLIGQDRDPRSAWYHPDAQPSERHADTDECPHCYHMMYTGESETTRLRAALAAARQQYNRLADAVEMFIRENQYYQDGKTPESHLDVAYNELCLALAAFRATAPADATEETI